MITILRLKHKALGLRVIVAVAIFKSILPLFLLFDHPAFIANSFENQQAVWSMLRLPILFFLLWAGCFILVKLVQNHKIQFLFFEKFGAWKGLAILLIWPCVLFWIQIGIDYHHVLDFLHPFTSLVFVHAMAVLLCIVFVPLFVIPLAYKSLRGKKLKKSEVTLLQNIRHDLAPNLLWVRFFFKEVASDKMGNGIAYFTGISYLIFFYMTVLSLATPATLANKTAGSVIDVQDINYIWASKYASHRGSYCVLKINSNNEPMQFVINSCPPCSRQMSANVVVTHHPVDYNNRRLSSVECESR